MEKNGRKIFKKKKLQNIYFGGQLTQKEQQLLGHKVKKRIDF